MSDLEHDGYTQRALAVGDLAMAHEKATSRATKQRLLKAMDALIHHMNHPRGEFTVIPNEKTKGKQE